jgi:hypothetical protein
MAARRVRLLVGLVLIAGAAMVWPRAQATTAPPSPQDARGGGPGGGGRRAGGPMAQGTLTPMTPDARGWGWQVKASVNPNTPRPFYNVAKELLFQDKPVTSYTVSSFNPDL